MSAGREISNKQEELLHFSEDVAHDALEDVARVLREKPFVPHHLFTSGHAQTLAGYVWPRRKQFRDLESDEVRLFEVAPGVSMLAHCRWHKHREEWPTLLLIHGLEGSSQSI